MEKHRVTFLRDGKPVLRNVDIDIEIQNLAPPSHMPDLEGLFCMPVSPSLDIKYGDKFELPPNGNERRFFVINGVNISSNVATYRCVPTPAPSD